jgi:hypothetical protein
MVAMGGGPEVPYRESESRRELLLAVLPWPQEETTHIVKEIEDEFPNLDVHYIHETYEKKADRANTKVPEGKTVTSALYEHPSSRISYLSIVILHILLFFVRPFFSHILSPYVQPFSTTLSPDIIYVSHQRTDLYKRASILATLSWLPPSAKNAPNLDLVQLFSAGSNHIAQHPIYTDSDIPLATASGVHGPQIAEWVIMTHLIQTHKYLGLYEAQKKKDWVQSKGMGVRDAVGRRVGVLGFGSIGRQGMQHLIVSLSVLFLTSPLRRHYRWHAQPIASRESVSLTTAPCPITRPNS